MRREAQELVIVGGGPAGSAAAIALARGGARPLLLERQRETGDALCGGFLSWRTIERLERLGVAAGSLNPTTISKVRLFAGNRRAEAALPQPARCVSRRRLDALLLDAAQSAGAAVERGIAVRSIEETLRLYDGAELRPAATFLASGKHDVRGQVRPAEARGTDPMLGLRVRIAATPALTSAIGEAIELHLFSGGYCGVALQEDGSANLCMAVHRSRLGDAGSPEALLARLAAECPTLGERLAYRSGREAVDAVANVPYGWRARRGSAGLFRLGDQAGVIPSLAGEGMGIAIASGVSAAEAWLAGGEAASARWQRAFARRLARPIGIAASIAQLGERAATARAITDLVRLAPALAGLAARLTRI